LICQPIVNSIWIPLGGRKFFKIFFGFPYDQAFWTPENSLPFLDTTLAHNHFSLFFWICVLSGYKAILMLVVLDLL
jgi:hypothetical protein